MDLKCPIGVNLSSDPVNNRIMVTHPDGAHAMSFSWLDLETSDTSEPNLVPRFDVLHVSISKSMNQKKYEPSNFLYLFSRVFTLHIFIIYRFDSIVLSAAPIMDLNLIKHFVLALSPMNFTVLELQDFVPMREISESTQIVAEVYIAQNIFPKDVERVKFFFKKNGGCKVGSWNF